MITVFIYITSTLTLIQPTWRIWWAPNNSSRWQIIFNSAFKGLNIPYICPRVTNFGITLYARVLPEDNCATTGMVPVKYKWVYTPNSLRRIVSVNDWGYWRHVPRRNCWRYDLRGTWAMWPPVCAGFPRLSICTRPLPKLIAPGGYSCSDMSVCNTCTES